MLGLSAGEEIRHCMQVVFGPDNGSSVATNVVLLIVVVLGVVVVVVIKFSKY